MKTESLLWYIRMMEFTYDTDDRIKLLKLAYDEGVSDGVVKALTEISTPLVK